MGQRPAGSKETKIFVRLFSHSSGYVSNVTVDALRGRLIINLVAGGKNLCSISFSLLV